MIIKFVKRGTRLSDYYMRWRTIDHRFAIARSMPPGMARTWYALKFNNDRWEPIEKSNGTPKRYRKRSAAVAVVENAARCLA